MRCMTCISRARERGLILVCGRWCLPESTVAKRVHVRIREKEGFKHPWLWRAPCFWGTYEWELHAVDT